MRRTLALATALGAAWAAVAAADGGGPSPGPSWGSPGKVFPEGSVRYIAIPAGAAHTVVETIRMRDGIVLRWGYLDGMFGIPMVAWDGAIGGLSRDGSRLVLATRPGPRWTRFVVLEPRSMRMRAHVRLRGSFAFDALSPDGSLMYLIQYLGDPNTVNQPYAVRVFSWARRTLYPGALVDRREPDEKMNGAPVTRTGTGSGWAYTLYSRTGKRPFVHALDTVHRRAFCVDLPWKNAATWIYSVKLRVRGRALELRRDGRTIARVDRKTLEVRT